MSQVPGASAGRAPAKSAPKHAPRLLCLVLVAAVAGCAKGKPSERDRLAAAQAALAELQRREAARTSEQDTSAARDKPGRLVEHDEPAESTDAGTQKTPSSGDWIIDDLSDVGPAGPAAATPRGVILVTRDNELVQARWTPPARSPGRRPGPTVIAPVDLPRERFAPFGRGPAVLGDHVYWISKGRLVRRALENGPLEALTNDARDFTRVAAPSTGEGAPMAVAYIASRPSDGEMVARVWAEGHGVATLSPEGSAAISVALARKGDSLVALSIEGRMGMSPVHARSVTFSGGKAKLGRDRVVWVAGSSDPLTEVHGLGSPGHRVWCLLPTERDTTRFGLARFAVDSSPSEEVEVSWRDYPNGLQPAPVAAAALCERDVVVYVRPSTAVPHAPQELHWATLDDRGLGPSTVVATARAFSDVSLSPVSEGGLLVWVADHRTWARTLRCPKSRQ
jgi:predicted transcriptional regulator